MACQGGSEAKGGFYLKRGDWEIVTIEGSKGMLPGSADVKYVRVPGILLVPAALVFSIGYVLFLPAAGFVALFGALGAKISRSRGIRTRKIARETKRSKEGASHEGAQAHHA